ncbi:Subtilisin-like serine protease [Psilocybe cubensis]|uniref:Subtilisin-like serine protease n=2 Tax=Psilocybe cubensis TaxID=181762 RepID=A0ACB8HD80_PSICU|nr:Subtilisin-like serine protease [Psilocybe cubensis]KAH9485672.1 Subtilisin-like serine protease [Psilocybe cubensis]
MSALFQWSLLAVSIASTAFSTPLSTSPNFQAPSSPLSVAPLVATEHIYGSINNSYIVVLKDDIPSSLIQNHMNFLQAAHASDPLVGDDFAGVQQVYDGHINGYAGRFTDSVVDQIRKMPEVAYVEKDQIVRTQEVQKGAPWGLARISHRPKLTFGTFTKYLYNSDGGDGVDVYVIDTGINVAHVEFEGRASWGKTVPANDVDDDGNGHGTHCAGTIASKKYGVAKKANVIAVKVLGSNGSGSMSDVVSGVVWAANQAKVKAAAAAAELASTGKTKHKGSVANMSLGGGKSQALDDAVNKAVKGGLHFAVAAGNDNRDACNYSPAAAANAVTVGASTLGDERAYFSNHGECVDVFAPGLNIVSTFKGSNTAIATLSGTSMASPHTAGLLAYLLSIYPSKEFDPSFNSADELLSLQSQRVLSSPFTQSVSPSSLYAVVHRALPSFMTTYLPSPKFFDIVLGNADDVAPIPSTLTPAQLKKALIALSTPDVLSDLPAKTVNKLIFNNYTSSA